MSEQTKPINIMALTQGINIDVYLRLLEQMRLMGYEIGQTGALVSYASHFKKSPVVKSYNEPIAYIKEWEIVAQALAKPCDLADLKRREDALSPASVWNAIIGDRRLIYGKRAKFTQDYRVHFTDEQLWSIAYQFMLAYEEMLDRIQPDVIVGFTPVTFGELLGLEIAASRGIPTLQLHSSRIKNYFALHDVVSGTSTHFHGLMDKGVFREDSRQTARAIIEETAKKGLIYEGANKSIAKGRPFKPLEALKAFPRAAAAEALKFKDPVLRRDHHDPGCVIPWFYTHIKQPLAERYIKMRLNFSGRMVDLEEMESGNFGEFCFFPLQSEPEVSLQVLGRPYHKNQIELLRNLAGSLPAGMKLVVKEHPRSMGLRPYAYYKSLFEIPNLYLADVHAPSIPMVKACSFVGVISGTIGFEAIMMGKPVLILGHPKYEDVRGNMTRKCFNLFDMPAIIRELLENYKYEPEHIESFICALIEGSVAIDLYSNLLQKPGRHSFQDGQVSQEDDLKKLAVYTMTRIREVMA